MPTLCPTCHTENSETANFCSNCAAVLRPSQSGSGTGPHLDSPTRTYESRAWDLPTGTLFAGRYQIIEPLGRGGMGRVYRALDTKANEEVAIKLIRPDVAEDKRTLERFVNEIKLAHKVSHRNIGKMYHLGEDQGLHFITMEYVPGEDLKSFIRRSRRLDIATTVTIAKQVCSGLSEAHDAGIVHRDLKPSNIMIDREGNARILDFGIARAVGAQGVTAEGSVIGTPEYMSPEQVEGKEADRRADLYALGVIMFEMVTGRLPFAADTPFVVAFKQQSERPTPPEELNPQTPPQLSAIILRCLEKDREKRYQTTEDLCRDLGQPTRGPRRDRPDGKHQEIEQKGRIHELPAQAQDDGQDLKGRMAQGAQARPHGGKPCPGKRPVQAKRHLAALAADDRVRDTRGV